MDRNWVVVIPRNGEPLVSIGDKRHFELLEELNPELKKEINNWAVGNKASDSENILARGRINLLNKILFQECSRNADRNKIYDIVWGASGLQKSSSKNYMSADNVLSVLVARANNEHIPDEEDLDALRMFSKNLATCESWRILNALNEMMSAENPAAAIRLAEQVGALEYMLPELSMTKGFWQRYKNTSSELFTHLMMTLDCVAKHTSSDKRLLRWTAMLHDIGKPSVVWVDEDGRTRFQPGPNGEGGDHAKAGCLVSMKMLERIGMPPEDIERIVYLISLHMFEHFRGKSGAKDFIKMMGDYETATDLLTLRLGDVQGKPKQEKGEKEIAKMKQLLKTVNEGDWDVIDSDSEAVRILKEFDII